MRLIVIAFTIIASCNTLAQKKEAASQLIEKSIDAMGGRKKLTAIQNLQVKGYGYHNALEQSERFEGPYIPCTFNFKSIIDYKDTLAQYSIQENVFNYKSDVVYFINPTLVALKARGHWTPWAQNQTIQDDLFLNPLSVLSRAAESSSLLLLKDSVIQRVPHKRLKFLWRNHPVIVSINSNTLLPTLVEIEKVYEDSFMGVWGDVKKTVHYSFWDLLDNGVHYPLQKDIYFMGRLWESSVITEAKINQPLQSDSLRITAEGRAVAFGFEKTSTERIKKMMESKSEIVKDVWLIPGFCNSTVIRLNDAIVIIEAPNTSTNTDWIIEQATNLFPTLAIKSIVTTSDAWLHCGGVRSAAARANVIALRENQEIIEALLRADYKTSPDAWQKSKEKKATVTYVDKRTTFGTGANRFELIPYRTEAGERMMMVYFPEHKLLYASDLLQPGNWEKHYSLEVIQAVAREKIDVATVYAMHMKPTPYADIIKSMNAYLPD